MAGQDYGPRTNDEGSRIGEDDRDLLGQSGKRGALEVLKLTLSLWGRCAPNYPTGDCTVSITIKETHSVRLNGGKSMGNVTCPAHVQAPRFTGD